MFNFFKQTIKTFFNNLNSKIRNIFIGDKFNDETLENFFELLILSDIGVSLAQEIVKKLKEKSLTREIKNADDALIFVKNYFTEILNTLPKVEYFPDVAIMLGINGAGKTTTVAKLANLFTQNNRKVLVVAADTFRIAAIDQLKSWSEKIPNTQIFIGKENADPSSVIFESAIFAKENQIDNVIIDTAGRLHTNWNLVKELEKCWRITQKSFEGKSIKTWIVLDSMLGQSSLEQIKFFSKNIKIDGIILTKLDSSAKGGVILAIAKEFNLPIIYLTFAENDLLGIKIFDVGEYLEQFFGK